MRIVREAPNCGAAGKEWESFPVCSADKLGNRSHRRSSPRGADTTRSCGSGRDQPSQVCGRRNVALVLSTAECFRKNQTPPATTRVFHQGQYVSARSQMIRRLSQDSFTGEQRPGQPPREIHRPSMIGILTTTSSNNKAGIGNPPSGTRSNVRAGGSGSDAAFPLQLTKPEGCPKGTPPLNNRRRFEPNRICERDSSHHFVTILENGIRRAN